MANTSKLFRQKSLERLNSPERLDELMQVVGPKSWIALGTLGVLVGLGITWSIVGQVPVSVEGRGILIHPRQVIDLQAPRPGTLVELNLRPGQRLAKGDVVGVLDKQMLRVQLTHKKEALARQRARRGRTLGLHSQQVKLEKEGLQRQREILIKQIKESKQQADDLKTGGKEEIRDRRATIEKQLGLFREMNGRLKARLDRYRDLEKKGVVSKSDVLQLEQSVLSSLLTIQNLEANKRDLAVREIQNTAADLQRRHRILDLETRLETLRAQESQQALSASEFSMAKDLPIETLEQDVARLGKQLQEESRILSPYSGKVLEVSCAVGQAIAPGAKMCVLETEDTGQPLISLTCFPVKDGKRLSAGMAIQVAPENVERERFGSLLGEVSEVVSFPVTSEEVSKLIGNREVAQSLVPPLQGCILVYGKLKPDAQTPSGYGWSSSTGPDVVLSSGTTTQTRVVVEMRAPISFILPVLRSSTGS